MRYGFDVSVGRRLGWGRARLLRYTALLTSLDTQAVSCKEMQMQAPMKESPCLPALPDCQWLLPPHGLLGAG